MALGGRVAESITFNRVTTGAQNDLQKVTRIAYAQVRSYGMSPTLGHISFPEEEPGSRQTGRRPYSKRLANTIDEEARFLITNAYKRTESLLLQHKDMLEKVGHSIHLEEIFITKLMTLNCFRGKRCQLLICECLERLFSWRRRCWRRKR